MLACDCMPSRQPSQEFTAGNKYIFWSQKAWNCIYSSDIQRQSVRDVRFEFLTGSLHLTAASCSCKTYRRSRGKPEQSVAVSQPRSSIGTSPFRRNVGGLRVRLLKYYFLGRSQRLVGSWPTELQLSSSEQLRAIELVIFLRIRKATLLLAAP
jgi:hypothetical protein